MRWIAGSARTTVSFMRGLNGRSLVWTLALAFAVSGAAANYCLAAHVSSGHSIVGQSVDANVTHDAMLSDLADHHAQHDRAGSEHVSHAPATDHDADVACAKCCSTCTLSSAVMPPAASQVSLAESVAVFFAKSALRDDAPKRVDPGIPRRIV